MGQKGGQKRSRILPFLTIDRAYGGMLGAQTITKVRSTIRKWVKNLTKKEVRKSESLSAIVD